MRLFENREMECRYEDGENGRYEICEDEEAQRFAVILFSSMIGIAFTVIW